MSVQRALNLAERGLFVFPVCENTKIPAFEGWQAASTRDTTRIRAWWSSNPKFPIGVHTGKYGQGKHLCVVDVDVKNGGMGPESLAALCEEHGDEWLDTLSVRTRSGGRHYYFQSARPLQGCIGTVLGPGIDVKSCEGKGGLVIGPGSEYPDGRYEIVADKPILEAPEWLAQKLGPPRQRSRAANDHIEDVEANVTRARDMLRSAAPAVQGQGGDSHTFKTACRVHDFGGVSQLTCRELMLDEWNDRCSPPWDPDDLLEKICNAYEFANGDAGHLDPTNNFDPVSSDELGEGLTADPPAEGPTEFPTAGPAIRRIRAERICDVSYRLDGRYLVKNLMSSTGSVGIIAAFGGFKTQVVLELARCVATGAPFCSRKTLRGAVFIISGEGTAGMRGRFQGMKLRDPAAESAPIYLVSEPVDLRRKADIDALLALIFETERATGDPTRLVIGDTLTSLTPGLDQNSAEGMSVIVASQRRIAREANCVAMLVHHMGRDASKGSRGSTVLPGDFDTELQLEAAGQGRIRMRQTKQRDLERGPDIYFVARSIEIGRDADGDPVTAPYVEHADDPASWLGLTPAETFHVECLQQAILASDSGEHATSAEWQAVFAKQRPDRPKSVKKASSQGGDAAALFRQHKRACVKKRAVEEIMRDQWVSLVP